ncbi:MAG TPA: type II secretion system protein [Burkholderiales bacterium]|nr:type II secretion system protein [Burkholderiales bacterium]
MRRVLRAQGFTFVEILISLAIVAVLTSICLPLAEVSVQRKKEEQLRVALRQIRGGLDAYRQAFDDGKIKRELGDTGYPKSLRALVDGVDDASSASGGRLYFLRRLVRDPFYPDANVPPDQTWGKRSYASPPSAPKEGKDVYDVYSLAQGKGLNGVEYKEW